MWCQPSTPYRNHSPGNLKKQCGCGGTVKEFSIEIQTDNREQLKTILEKLNYQVKLAGS